MDSVFGAIVSASLRDTHLFLAAYAALLRETLSLAPPVRLRRRERLLLLVLASLAPVAHAQAPIEEVLVTGEHPGPGLWKVTRDDSTLWILGTHTPLPTQLTWRSQQVEWVMTEAQQVIGPYSAAISLRGGDPFATKGPPLRKVL